MPVKRLIIYGTGHLDIIKLVNAINRHEPAFKVLGFINDLPEKQGLSFLGYPVLGGQEIIPRYAAQEDVVFLNNINATVRDHRKIANILAEHHCRVASLVHPAVDLDQVDCGEGAIIPEGCVVGGQVRIGRYFTCRLKSLLSHNVNVGDFVYVGPGVTCAGFVTLKDGCFIGAGATILNNVTVGAGAVIGAGSLVVKDIPDGVLAFGSPAKVVRPVTEDERII